jgi:acyl dehydratase
MSEVEVELGLTLPDLVRTITLPDMVAYAGATWDFHRMHYDPEFVAAKAFPAPVVDGQVFGALLAKQLQDYFGPHASLRSLHFRFKNLVFAGETVRCCAQVSEIAPDPDGDGDLVSLDCSVEVLGADGEPVRTAVAPAAATVAART